MGAAGGSLHSVGFLLRHWHFKPIAGTVGCQVVGVESNAEAIKIAHLNRDRMVLCPNSCIFLHGTVEQTIRQLSKKKVPECVVVNPPRIGMQSAVVDTLLDMQPRHLLYISCLPATLARDLAPFFRQAIALEKAWLLICFHKRHMSKRAFG